MLTTDEEVGGVLTANAKYAPGTDSTAAARKRNES